ncbi:hypothetical protein GCM10011392_21180 [Wenxinia marina]|uniref:Uncharacterized protein n=1 Tax=Wenxinia marina DSM 24838 TaxID=1123501 RepID=A0A0D0Q7S4_9RHOB|nr:hypothetical protein Wenmar_02778 [Wenxinia marina DSM 24838]GGL66411.1 hypothetical protein GCM10011392_21180 [Wenxinia marina]
MSAVAALPASAPSRKLCAPALSRGLVRPAMPFEVPGHARDGWELGRPRKDPAPALSRGLDRPARPREVPGQARDGWPLSGAVRS